MKIYHELKKDAMVGKFKDVSRVIEHLPAKRLLSDSLNEKNVCVILNGTYTVIPKNSIAYSEVYE